jgi:hypothetical protein
MRRSGMSATGGKRIRDRLQSRRRNVCLGALVEARYETDEPGVPWSGELHETR